MSEANVQLARDAIEAFNRGDLEALVEQTSDDLIFDWTHSQGPLTGVYRGGEGLAEFIRELWSSFETVVMESSEFIDRGRHIVVPNTVRARGRDGIEVTANATHVFHHQRRPSSPGRDVPGAGRGDGSNRGVTKSADLARPPGQALALA